MPKKVKMTTKVKTKGDPMMIKAKALMLKTKGMTKKKK